MLLKSPPYSPFNGRLQILYRSVSALVDQGKFAILRELSGWKSAPVVAIDTEKAHCR